MTEDKREHKLPNGDVVYFKKPGMSEHNEAEWEYAKRFNEAITNGIVPKAVMLERLRAMGVWSDKDDEATVGLEEAMADAMATLQEAADAGDRDAYEAARVRVSDARDDLIRHNARLNAYLNNCAEEKAAEARIFYLAYACTVDAKDARYWRSFEAFKTDKNPENINSCYVAFMLFINGLAANIVDSLPENTIKLRDAAVPAA